MQDNLNQNQISPDEAAASLSLATKLNEELFKSSQQPTTPENVETLPGEDTTKSDISPVEGDNSTDSTELLDTKINSLRNELKEEIKSQINTLKEMLEKALEEDEEE